MIDLTDRERAVLDFEAGPHWRYRGAKEAEVRRRFGWSLTRHTQVVNALLDRPEALAYAPMTVKRLRRVREAKALSRKLSG